LFGRLRKTRDIPAADFCGAIAVGIVALIKIRQDPAVIWDVFEILHQT
jgi:hypothetical protein